HLITEGDTLYLAACTKGATAASVRKQPFSDIPAKQRAYSLKSSYMTRILNQYIFGKDEDEHIIKDWRVLQKNGFEDYIIDQLKPYYGMTQTELKSRFGVDTMAKSLNYILLARMLGINGDIRNTQEFQNANIIPKTIRIQKNGSIKESMSFPTFKFMEIIQEEWEDSALREYIEPAKFLFIIFKEREDGQYAFERIKFWNIPAEDLEEVKCVWERTVQTIKNGVRLERVNNEVRNNLPKSTENRVAHVRPHARNANDTYPLPDGREMTKQCFWFNSSYVLTIVQGE
ncbi:MAG: restriction endonuclease, partial [Clostridia bacterium]|nr:restriction endonuclease [Clostridia bacterium]